jgi:hypothetical protein
MRMPFRAFNFFVVAIVAAAGAAAAQSGATCSISAMERADATWEIVGTGFPPGVEVRVQAVNRSARQTLTASGTSASDGSVAGVFLGQAGAGAVALAPGVWRVRARSGAATARTRFVVRAREPLVGSWGGDHVGLVLDEKGGTLQFDCAHGTVDAPVVLAADGSFDVKGTFVRERGGPVRQNEAVDGHPARLTGRVADGTRMTLSVRLTDSDESVGDFALDLGAMPRVYRCE